MISTKQVITILASALAVIASPTARKAFVTEEQVTRRQASEIPPNSLYLIEWYPNGCGNGQGVSLTGGEETLAACVKFNGLFDPNAPDQASVRFLFPEDDDRTFQWKLFGTNDCSQQIAIGEGAGCFSVPANQDVGAVIVYT